MQCWKQIVYLFEKYKPTLEQMKGGKSTWKWMKFYAECLNVPSYYYAYEMLTNLLNLFSKCKTSYMKVTLSPCPCWRIGSDWQLLLQARSWSQQHGIYRVVVSVNCLSGLCLHPH